MSHDNPAASGPAWDLDCEYPSAEHASFKEDFAQYQLHAAEVSSHSEALEKLVLRQAELDVEQRTLAIGLARKIHQHLRQAGILLGNLGTWVLCRLSTDSEDELLRGLQSRISNEYSLLSQMSESFQLFLRSCSEEDFEAFLQDPVAREGEFQHRQARKLADFNLGLKEEQLQSALAVDGHHAWGQLYSNLASTIRVPLKGEELGLAQLGGKLQDPDRGTREAAWKAINSGWRQHHESVAQGLNSLAGWRLALNRKLSQQAGREIHFLESPLLGNNLQAHSLHNLIQAAEDHQDLAREALRLVALAHGIERAAPWDLQAPLPASLRPEDKGIGYEEGMDHVCAAFERLDPAMGAFARAMQEKGFIEGRNMPGKRTGAYCTRFRKSGTQRVYMTWSGSSSNLRTLAHELGHAYHGHVMRDLPPEQQGYPMCLAETASILAESLLTDYMMEQAASPAEQLPALWSEVNQVHSMLLNIPCRFTFEHEFYERRGESIVGVKALSRMMSEHWQRWYGDALSEVDPGFWASKLHFSMSHTSFYNFPYLFGYLFSLSVLQERERLGASFHEAYVALLCDTGRATVEEVARRHLDRDVTQKEFWKPALDRLAERVAHFREALAERGLRP